jgi:hypothetical protein
LAQDLRDLEGSIGRLHAYSVYEVRRFEETSKRGDGRKRNFRSEFDPEARKIFDGWPEIDSHACELFGHPTFGLDTWRRLWDFLRDTLRRRDGWQDRLQAERQRLMDAIRRSSGWHERLDTERQHHPGLDDQELEERLLEEERQSRPELDMERLEQTVLRRTPTSDVARMLEEAIAERRRARSQDADQHPSGRRRLQPAERTQLIQQFLAAHSDAESKQVAKELGIPEQTVRKDPAWKENRAKKKAEGGGGRADRGGRVKDQQMPEKLLESRAGPDPKPDEIVEATETYEREYLENASSSERAEYHKMTPEDKRNTVWLWKHDR